METTKKKSKTIAIIKNIVFYVVLAFVVVVAAFSLTSRFTKGKIGNTQYLVVVSSSMDGEKQDEYDIKTIPVKSLISVSLVPSDTEKEKEFYSSLKKGDVITFNYLALGNNTITHRIIEEPTKDSNGIYKYTVKGDAVEGDDTQILYSDGRTGEIIGKVKSVNTPLGKFYFFLNSKVGTLVLVILPATALCIYEVCKIIYLVSEDKKKKKEELVLEESRKKDAEIEELKKQLAEKNQEKDSKEDNE